MIQIVKPKLTTVVAASGTVEKNFFTIHHTNDQNDRPVLFYMREAALNILKGLLCYKLAVLEGSPGSGKSLTAWLYALKCAEAKPNMRIYWLDDHSKITHVLHDDHCTTSHGLVDADTLQSTDLVIVDQITGDENYLGYLRLRVKVRQLVLVTSQRLNNKSTYVKECQGKIFKMPPWRLEDYKAACDHAPFFETVLVSLGVEAPPAPAPLFQLDFGPDIAAPAAAPGEGEAIAPAGGATTVAEYVASKALRDELLEDKFFFAGHSCRYMFSPLYHEKHLRAHILSHIVSVSDLASAMTGNISSAGASNSLFVDAWVDGKLTGLITPVSQFALKEMGRRLAGANFTTVSSFACSNADRNGFLDTQILEMDVIKAVQNNELKRRAKLVVNVAGHWRISKNYPSANTFLCTRALPFHRVLAPLEVYEPNSWFFPRTTQPGGFHLVQLYERAAVKGGGGAAAPAAAAAATMTLRFVQVTRDAMYGLNLNDMALFADSFNAGREATSIPPPVTHFEVMIMTTMEQAVNYKINPPTSITGGLLNWDINQLQVVAFTRAHELK